MVRVPSDFKSFKLYLMQFAQLKKRQQKKAVESSAPVSDVASLPSRTSTPAPSKALAGDQKQDSSDDVYVFS